MDITEPDEEGFRYGLDRAKCGAENCLSNGRKRSQKWLGVKSMELIGWRKINNQWICPFCTGNTQNLFKVFNKTI